LTAHLCSLRVCCSSTTTCSPERSRRSACSSRVRPSPAPGLRRVSVGPFAEAQRRLTSSKFPPLLPPPPRTKWTRRVPHPVLIGHAARGREDEPDERGLRGGAGGAARQGRGRPARSCRTAVRSPIRHEATVKPAVQAWARGLRLALACRRAARPGGMHGAEGCRCGQGGGRAAVQGEEGRREEARAALQEAPGAAQWPGFGAQRLSGSCSGFRAQKLSGLGAALAEAPTSC